MMSKNRMSVLGRMSNCPSPSPRKGRGWRVLTPGEGVGSGLIKKLAMTIHNFTMQMRRSFGCCPLATPSPGRSSRATLSRRERGGGARLGLFALILALALAGCEVGPDYQRPKQDMGLDYKSAATQPSTQPATQPARAALGRDWWKLFGDPELDNLEATALQGNPDIKAAMERIIEARALARITKSQFYPTLTFDPSVTRSRSITNRLNGPGPAITENLFLLPVDASYEVDIWGQIRREYEGTLALAQASADDYEVVLQMMETTIAIDYFNIRSLDSQYETVNRNVEDYRKQVGLLETQFRAGLVLRLDVLQAQAQLDSTVPLALDIQRQRADTEHALAILLGALPKDVNVSTKPLDLVPPAIPMELPAQLLRRRPDVAEAEQNLVNANAQVGVAVGAFYPQLNLLGSAGFESLNIQHVLDWSNTFWSIGPSLTIPIFEGGRLKAGLEENKARFRELAMTYRSTVLGAVRDVEVSLTDLNRFGGEVSAQDRAVRSSDEYLRLSEVQYRQGLINYLTVIDAERTVLTNQLTAEQLANSRLAAAVSLTGALGGGWDAQSKEAAQPAVPETQPATQPATQPSTQP